ncbi:MAG: SGNH/GDSL hydrolase family protein [Vicinamibacteria bacterium]|nr:SGNH/GDSL hydrolase family protein [Vicinamibacteria bacterium]
MAPGRPRFAEAALLLGGATLGLLGLEGAVRLTAPQPLRRNGYPVVRGGASFRPENSAGYRDVEHTRKKPPGVHRAVFVGDSFTYGAGVLFDDTYGRRVARGLSEDRGELWEAVVLSIPGIATAREAEIARKEAFEYEPDLLFLGYVLNDAEASGAAEQRRAEEWRAEMNRPETRPPFWRRSALLSLIADRVRATRENRARIANYLALYEDDQPGYRAVVQGLTEIATLAHEHKVPLIVAVFPLFGNPLDRSYPFESIHQKLAEVCRPLGVMFVDLLPYYRGLDWKLLVVEGAADEHPNEVAHRIAAEALLRAVDGPRNHAAPEPWP